MTEIEICKPEHEAECFANFKKYMVRTNIIAWDDTDYPEKREDFISVNSTPCLSDLPGPILPSYITSRENPDVQNIKTAPCGLSKDFLALLYDLQHLRFTDETVQRGKKLIISRTYHSSQNQSVFSAISNNTQNDFYNYMVYWARLNSNIAVPVRIVRKEAYTPPATKRNPFTFYMTNRGILGSHSIFEKERVKKQWIDVYDCGEPEEY